MAVPTWSQLTFLTGPQQAIAAQFETYGKALSAWKGSGSPKPSQGTLTYSQAKAAEKLFKDLGTLLSPALLGIREVKDNATAQAVSDFDAANP